MSGAVEKVGVVERIWPVLGLVLIVGLITFAAAASGSPALSRTVTEALVRIVVVVGIYIFVGNSGVLVLWPYQLHGHRRLCDCLANLLSATEAFYNARATEFSGAQHDTDFAGSDRQRGIGCGIRTCRWRRDHAALRNRGEHRYLGPAVHHQGDLF